MAIPSAARLLNGELKTLSGWKEIANYLGMGVRTVQRYECKLRLPVRRPAGKLTGSVFATKAELDAWIIESPVREAFQLPSPAFDNAALLNEFRQHVKELRRLRQESAELREELHGSVELLRANLSCCFPQQDPTRNILLVSRGLTDVLPFDPMKKNVN